MLLTPLYYRCKRFIPKRLRLSLRRVHARRILRNCGSAWPIKQSSARKPKHWPGWPDRQGFAFVLTHDVEGPRGLDRVQALAELEMELGFRSSFNFVPEGEYVVPAHLRTWLNDRGFEVGVHDLHHDGSLFRSHSDFHQQAPRINQHLKEWGAVGFRAGFMFHELDWIRALDIEYDASTFDTDPFEPQPQGADTIFPFLVPPKDGRPGYVELPYTLVQDSTLFLFLQQPSADIWKRKLDWIAEQEGLALVNVHPDYIALNGLPSSSEFPLERYRDLLTYVKHRYADIFWNVVPRDLARWFISNVGPAVSTFA
jgi:hypothetical protein